MAALHCWRPGQATVPMCVQLAGMPGPLDAKGRGHWGEDENGRRLQLAAVALDDSAPHDGDGGEEVMPGCAKLYPQRLLRRQALTTSSTASRTADMEQGTALLRKSPCPSAECKPSRLFTAIASIVRTAMLRLPHHAICANVLPSPCKVSTRTRSACFTRDRLHACRGCHGTIWVQVCGARSFGQ